MSDLALMRAGRRRPGARMTLAGFFRPMLALALASSASGSGAVAQTMPPPPPQLDAPSKLATAGATRAQLVAARRAVLSSALTGRIERMPLREGDRFKQGDVLVAYDCALHRARLERAVQAESAARKKLAVAEQLDTLKSISRSDVEQARAAVSVARAESGAERVMVDRCTLNAPFAGRVGETYARAAESVSEGQKLLSIYDDGAFELETIVPSRWLAWLKPGYPMQVTVDETGLSYDAEVSHIAGAVDPVSQSVKIIGRLSKPAEPGAAALLPGMSGDVRVTPPGSTEESPK